MSKIIVSLSGGIDSATALVQAKKTGAQVEAIGFNYGSKHNQYENRAAEEIAKHCSVPFHLIDLSSVGALLKSDLLRSGGAIPEGHYEVESMKGTVVPARNMIFISILAGIADSRKASQVWLGIHAGDHHIYPDCRPGFFYRMADTVRVATEGRVELVAPYLFHSKGRVVARGLELGVPYNLTRTCYKDQPIACGKCGACWERLEAFAQNKTVDPLQYEGN